MSRPLPPLESVQNNANIVTIPEPVHRFTNGQVVLFKEASMRKYNGIFSIWAADKQVIQPQYNYPIALMGFGCDGYNYTDLLFDVERTIRDKVKVCGEHTTPAVTAVSKADRNTVKPTVIDGDNFEYVKLDLMKGNLRLGVILHGDKDCGLFRRSCTISKYVKDDGKKTSKMERKEDNKENDGFISNPFQIKRRTQFCERIGLDIGDMNWFIDNKKKLSVLVKQITSRHILFKKAPKTAVKWGKRLIMSGSGDIEKIPVDIREAMNNEMINGRKPKIASVLNDLGIVAKAQDKDIDIDDNVHLPNMEQMQQQLLQEMESKLRETFARYKK